MDRIFALAYKFDDNQVLDSWAFSNDAFELKPIIASMFGNYVSKHIIENDDIDKWSVTEYLGTMELIIAHYFEPPAAPVVSNPSAIGKFFGKFFGKSSAPVATPEKTKPEQQDPVYITFVTDGENNSRERVAIRNLLEKNVDKPIYWMFVGITDSSSPSFAFLKDLTRSFPNVEFFDAGIVDKLSNDQLYSQLISDKFVNWYVTIKGTK
jgi:hypothetical protein